MMTRTMFVLLIVLLSTFHPRPVQADTDTSVRVAVLMFDGIQIIDFSAPYEVFGQAGFTVHTVSADGRPVAAEMGLSVNVDYSFKHAPAADVLVIPGGNVMAASQDEATLNWVRKQATQSTRTLSVCTGSDIVAATGLLDGKSATTFHRHFEHMQQRFPDVEVVRNQRWVDNGRIVTSAGLASGIDAALHVVAELRGLQAARQVALHMEYDWNPESGFVRGSLADAHLRIPFGARDFPAGTNIEREYSVGDQTQWEMRYAVKDSPMTPPQLIQHLAELVVKDAEVNLLPQTNDQSIAWEYDGEDGNRWQVRFEIEKTLSESQFHLFGRLHRL